MSILMSITPRSESIQSNSPSLHKESRLDSSPHKESRLEPSSRRGTQSSGSPMSSPLRQMNNLIQYKSVLDNMYDKHQDRVRSMRPFSSPIRDSEGGRHGTGSADMSTGGFRSGPLSSPISRRSSSYHHSGSGDINGHSSVINQKNKHNKLRQVRDQYRQNKVEMRRGKTNELQYKEDVTKLYDQQFNTEGLDVDLDLLIEEERRRNEDEEEEYLEDYEKDLEFYELQEELEIADMLRDLELGD